MNFFKSSICHEYLYSPISWLHHKHAYFKILFIWTQSVFLPWMTLKYIFFYLLGFIYFCIFSHIPKQLKEYLRKIIMIFVFFIMISAQENYTANKDTVTKQIVIPIHILGELCNKVDQGRSTNINQPKIPIIYVPMPIVRLLSFSFIYLISTKVLVLTTKHEKIIGFIVKYSKNMIRCIDEQFNLEAVTSTQFLQIVLQEIETVNTAYIIRNTTAKKKYPHKENLLLLWLLAKHFSLKVYLYTHHISHTLYGRNIDLKT